MRDRWDVGLEGCRTEGKHDKRYARQVGCRTRGMLDRGMKVMRDAEQVGCTVGQEECRTGGMQDRRDVGQERCRSGGM